MLRHRTPSVVHVCTMTSGGAARSAIRLHAGLLREGVRSELLSLHPPAESVPASHVFVGPRPSRVERRLRRLRLRRSRSKKNRTLVEGRSGDFEIFTFPRTDFDLARDPRVQAADIVHLHWVADFLDWPSFFRNIDKPVVWTTHDMNPFLGGFHYAEDAARNEQAYGDLERRFREVKRNAVRDFRRLTVVSPSEWIRSESSGSEVLGGFPHHRIPYGLDTDLFKIYPRDVARTLCGLPLDQTVLLFVADRTGNRRKGLDLLQGAVDRIARDDLLPVAVGERPADPCTPGVRFLGRLPDERLMALAYASADLVVVPSREDNLPNVMLEALACGRPVVGFPIGGIREVVRPGVNGMLAEDVSSEALARTLTRSLEGLGAFRTDAIREDAVDQFALALQTRRSVELYRQVLDS